MRRGVADFMLAGGYDSMLNPVGLSGFCLLGALSTDNDEPTRASRPFDFCRSQSLLRALCVLCLECNATDDTQDKRRKERSHDSDVIGPAPLTARRRR